MESISQPRNYNILRYPFPYLYSPTNSSSTLTAKLNSSLQADNVLIILGVSISEDRVFPLQQVSTLDKPAVWKYSRGESLLADQHPS